MMGMSEGGMNFLTNFHPAEYLRNRRFVRLVLPPEVFYLAVYCP
jgi:hypothetical protein